MSRPVVVETGSAAATAALAEGLASLLGAGDVVVNNLATAGLPVESVIRTAKIATIEASDAEKLGKLSAAQFRQVSARLGQLLKIDSLVG